MVTSIADKRVNGHYIQAERIERRPMSYETFLDFASDSQKMEWVDGEVLIYMAASTGHQRLVTFLIKLFGLFIDDFELGELFSDPFLCRLWEGGPGREPDIAFIAADNPGTLDDQHFHGAPDLVIELISPSTVREDTHKKFFEYEQAGVREYWIIDPRKHYETVTVYQLEEGEFQPVLPDDEGRFHSAVLPNFWLKTSWLWESPLPKFYVKVAEVMLTIPDLPDGLRTMYQTMIDIQQSE